jgi:predicted ATPase
MRLEAIKYTRFKDSKNEWSIEGKSSKDSIPEWLTLDSVNLIVGKNATGKSKTINVIREMADLLAGDSKVSDLQHDTAIYEIIFNGGSVKYEYFLDFRDKTIIQEKLLVDGKLKLDRADKKLFYEKENKFLSFKTDENILSASRRDSEQQPFFDCLIDWGKSLTHYQFSSQLGHNMLLKDINLIKDSDIINLKDTSQVIEVFFKGGKRYGASFFDLIKNDMKSIGYPISKIEIKQTFFSAFGLSVQEKDLEDITGQTEMSQGMFRALSLLIQLNYSFLSKYPSCILIDDIGEGLDFDRSKSLINLIIEKVKDSNVQVIMTTNDRFVMNNIPIEHWSVIQRLPKKSIFYNYRNSKEIFDDFKYTGLNNFDFLSTNFYIDGFQETKS